MNALLLLISCSTEPAAPTVEEAPSSPEPSVEAAPPADWTTYGEAFDADAVVDAADLLASPADFVDQTLVVEGRVADVCQKAGCWMVIAEGDETMRVLMKDHAFSVAKDGAGSDCRVKGTVVAVELDPATVEHLEGESEKPELMPENKAEAGIVYQLEATGVALRSS